MRKERLKQLNKQARKWTIHSSFQYIYTMPSKKHKNKTQKSKLCEVLCQLYNDKSLNGVLCWCVNAKKLWFNLYDKNKVTSLCLSCVNVIWYTDLTFYPSSLCTYIGQSCPSFLMEVLKVSIKVPDLYLWHFYIPKFSYVIVWHGDEFRCFYFMSFNELC